MTFITFQFGSLSKFESNQINLTQLILLISLNAINEEFHFPNFPTQVSEIPNSLKLEIITINFSK